MFRAKPNDKQLVVDILTRSFIDNKSVNYIIKQDGKRDQRLKHLMEYSFDFCNLFGDVFISDYREACALVLVPDRKKVTLKSILLDIKLVLLVTGLSNTKKAISRESAIKQIHPNAPLYYLWFIGVEPSKQGHGTGSKLLDEIIQKGLSENRTICLETSTIKNLPWYEKHGFKTYRELDFGYKLYCMKTP
ncbi:GNAT family N-acetyltransferase [Flavihumibacter stibioxidans]|uniref:Acetyltransferase n=1 Tax=Flavihumibacter stibioxidans TaxID=1834163 RepID=A0ABR7M4S7_9BACT|nr:GNAT family N-acetyltransferase [Flavihumibacter stibioxidans]MBC6489623.1 acetyltransferase [Flavihumibacter stibioxidans]